MPSEPFSHSLSHMVGGEFGIECVPSSRCGCSCCCCGVSDFF